VNRTGDQADPGRAEGPPTSRRLAAILHADVVGYSRLMGADEAGTHAKLMAARALIDRRLAEQGGRVAGTAGDAVLAVFDSVVGALSAAVAIQRDLADEGSAPEAGERLTFRIGVNLGDVIVDGGDVFGEGVNVAARIEALAPPGGVAVTATVREQVGGRLPVTFTDLGAHAPKNIAAPVRVYSVTEGAAPATPPAPPGRRRLLRPLLVGVGVAAALAAAALTLPDLIPRDATRPRAEAEAERPVIAVLPFVERGGGSDDRYFADGVTEDVIGALGRFSGLVVLSWSAVAEFRDAAPSPTELGERLGVSYVVGGSIQRDGDRIRVGVQISDAADGALIWSERYQKDLVDVFEVQDRITRQVVSALAVRVTQVESARAFAAPTDSLGAYDSVLRGREAFRNVSSSANVEARALFERAIELDPDYADAHVELGWSHLTDFKFGWTQWPRRSVEAAGAAADRAIELDPLNAAAYTLRSDVLKFLGDVEGAERAIDTALDLNPNDANAHAIRASLMMFAGRAAEAIASAETAFRLDPYPRAEWVMSLMVGYYLEGRYRDAVEAGVRYARQIGAAPTHAAVLAAAHAMLGEEEAAAAAADKVRRSAPFFDAARLAGLIGSPEHGALLLEGLRRAGL
jgi:TolB-like protein/class 3 adenylate cyclase